MGVASSLLSVATLPVRVALGVWHRYATGHGTVLDVTVGPVGSLVDRERFRTALRRVGDDDHVAAVLLRLREPPGGWATVQDLRQAVIELRQKGKKVYAYLESPGNALVAIASVCDRVFALPTGELGLVGIGVELTFFGAALHRLGVTPDFEAAGAYKAFGEPFTRSFPSPANQEATTELVADLHDQLLNAIAEGRGRPVDAVRELFARAPLSAADAKEAGLVDELLYPDQLEPWLEEHHGKGTSLRGFTSWARRRRGLEILRALGESGPRVAVVHLEGNITVDAGSRSLAARAVTPLLEALRESDRVVAVVLHVNSPGGSALASDLMWREVDLLAKVKPVVASFADVAASGGVYLAAPAREIFVRAGTLTGSIGVFGGKLVVADGLRQLGVHSHPVVGAPNAAVFSASRPFTDDQRARFRQSLQRFYDGFVQRVADGRKKDVAVLEPHCRGRVWSGRAAVDRGLAERVGDLDAAVARARELAGLAPGRGRRVDVDGRGEPPLGRLARMLLPRLVPGAFLRVAERWWSPSLELVVTLQGQPLALLPFDLEVR